MVPPDNDVVVIVNCAVIVRVRFTIALCAGEPASVALNVSGVPVTAMAGVPLIAPVEAFSVNPVGSVPRISCQLHAPVPPVLASVCEYAVFTMPLASAVVVQRRAPFRIVVSDVLLPARPAATLLHLHFSACSSSFCTASTQQPASCRF